MDNKRAELKYFDWGGFWGSVVLVALASAILWFGFNYDPGLPNSSRIGIYILFGLAGGTLALVGLFVFVQWIRTMRERRYVFSTTSPVSMRLAIEVTKSAGARLDARMGRRPVLKAVLKAGDIASTVVGGDVSNESEPGYRWWTCVLRSEGEPQETGHRVNLLIKDVEVDTMRTTLETVDVFMHPRTNKPFALILKGELHFVRD